MLISCPKCKSVYNISIENVPVKGQKFKCAECGALWVINSQSDNNEVKPDAHFLQNEQKKELSKNDIDIMFSRFAHNTKELFSSEDAVEYMNRYEKIYHNLINFINPKLCIAVLLLLIIFCGSLISYINRYEITESFPQTERIYKKFHIKSANYGKDIIFKDVTISNNAENSDNGYSISGKLYNAGNNSSKLLPIKATFVDIDGNIEKEIIEAMPNRFLDSHYSAIFNISVDSLSPKTEKIILSLEDTTY